MSISIKKSVTINKSPEELYRFWHDFENLPQIMSHLKSVQTRDEKCSHWELNAPLGTSVEWDAEIIDDRENEMIAWRSLEGADVQNTGSVSFEHAQGGSTEVKVTMEYTPPAGVVGDAAVKLFGQAPEQQLEEDLLRFKQVMETSEASTTSA